ncbi:uncharacterized protein METZ01_LOCUS94344, partial [marine metagenome]
VVLSRDDAPDGDGDVGASEAGEGIAQFGHERQVPGGQRAHTHHVHIVLDGLSRHLARRREQRADVDVEAQVGERRGDDLLAPVVAVLAHLGDEDPWPAAVCSLEAGYAGAGVGHLSVLADLAVEHARDGAHLRDMAPP